MLSLCIYYSTAGLAIASTLVTPGSTIPISHVGPGGGHERGLGLSPLFCYIPSAEWVFPDGNIVPLITPHGNFTAPPNIIESRDQITLISLHRGNGFITPAGLYCCRSRTKRLCVTLGK